MFGEKICLLRALVAVAALQTVGEGGARITPGFGGVARQFGAVYGEYLPADQALTVAEVKHLGEELGDFLFEAGNKGGQRRKVRPAIATEGDEGDVLAAQPLDAPTAHRTLAAGAENDFEQHPRRVGSSTVQVVAIAGIENG